MGRGTESFAPFSVGAQQTQEVVGTKKRWKIRWWDLWWCNARASESSQPNSDEKEQAQQKKKMARTWRTDLNTDIKIRVGFVVRLRQSRLLFSSLTIEDGDKSSNLQHTKHTIRSKQVHGRAQENEFIQWRACQVAAKKLTNDQYAEANCEHEENNFSEAKPFSRWLWHCWFPVISF